MSPLASYIVETFVTLFGVVVLAVLVLYGGRRLGLGRPAGPLELLGRLPLDARRAVYLVRVGKLVYVVGASEGGLTRLGELDADAVPTSLPAVAPSASFARVLARVVGAGTRRPDRSEAPPAPRVAEIGGEEAQSGDDNSGGEETGSKRADG
jgi:flagellar protein FliO/FliZ